MITERPLTWEQEEKIRQVAASMSIENMPLTKQSYQNLKDMVTGKKTEQQIFDEIIKRYTNK